MALAARYKLPTIYDRRNSASAGGLIAFGPSFVDSYHRAGILVGRVLKGEKPADLPVELPTRFELVVNLKTAKSLGLQVPQSILARAARADRVTGLAAVHLPGLPSACLSPDFHPSRLIDLPLSRN